MLAQERFDYITPNEVAIERIRVFVNEFHEYHERKINGSCGLIKFEDISEWLKYADLVSKGLVKDRLASSIYFMRRVRDDKIIGVIDIRHYLNDEHFHNGTIGNSIIPTERGKGYATILMGWGIEQAMLRGISPIILSCDSDNPASERVIAKCGGVFLRSHTEESGNVILVHEMPIQSYTGIRSKDDSK